MASNVNDLAVLYAKLEEAQAIYTNLEAASVLPDVARVQTLVTLFDRAMRNGFDLGPMWDAVRSVGIVLAQDQISKLKADIVGKAGDIIAENE